MQIVHDATLDVNLVLQTKVLSFIIGLHAKLFRQRKCKNVLVSGHTQK